MGGYGLCSRRFLSIQYVLRRRRKSKSRPRDERLMFNRSISDSSCEARVQVSSDRKYLRLWSMVSEGARLGVFDPPCRSRRTMSNATAEPERAVIHWFRQN